MKDTCGVCGQWMGLHEFQTMRCPVDGSETGLFMDTVFCDEDGLQSTITAQADRIVELERVLKLGLYIMTVPAVRDIANRQLESGQASPIADFEQIARALLGEV